MEPRITDILWLMYDMEKINRNCPRIAGDEDDGSVPNDELWTRIRPVSRELYCIAAQLWGVRRHRLQRCVHRRLDEAMDRVYPAIRAVHPRDVVFSVLVDMAVLQGTARIVFLSLTRRAPCMPRSLHELRSVALEGFDLPALDDLRLAGILGSDPLSYKLMKECLIRAGEIRVFVGGIDSDWAEVDNVLNRAADAYAALQIHIWSWSPGKGPQGRAQQV